MEFFTIILPLALNDYKTVERCIKCISPLDICVSCYSAILLQEFFREHFLNPIALRKAKIIYNFGLSECSRVNETTSEHIN